MSFMFGNVQKISQNTHSIQIIWENDENMGVYDVNTLDSRNFFEFSNENRSKIHEYPKIVAKYFP